MGRFGGHRHVVTTLAAGVVVLAVACSSSGSQEAGTSASLTVRTGELPPGTGELMGAEPPYSEGGPAREALHASSGVLLGQPHRSPVGPPVVVRSVDEGRSWRRIALPGPTGARQRVLWAGAGRAAVMAYEAVLPFGAGGTPVVRTSEDAGATWRAVTVPDPNGAGRYILHGRWWKGRWIFLGVVERDSGKASYPAVWQSRDGEHLELDPGLLPGGIEHVGPNGLTVIGDALIAQGRDPSGRTQTWRTLDGLHWTLLASQVTVLNAGPLLRPDELSLDGGRTWTDITAVPGEGAFPSASRTGGTWWLIQSVQTGEHTEVQRLVRTDDGGRHLRSVPLPPRPRRCRASPSPDEVIDPPRKAGPLLVVVSSCTPTADAEGSTGPPEVQIAISRDDGARWSAVPIPASGRRGVPVAVTTRADHVTVVVQERPSTTAQGATHVLTLSTQ